MNNWPQAESVVLEMEREKTYLTLVDMFVDVVEPSIIQMILQNRKWDLDAALEDIMILSSPAQSNKTNLKPNPSKRPKSENGLERIKMSYSTNNSHSPPINANNQLLNNIPPNAMQFDMSSHSKRSSMPFLKMKNAQKNKLEQSGKSSISVMKPNQENILPFVEHYNYLKTIPQAFNRTVMLIRDGVKLMVMLRGLPGSGKSNLAGKLLTEAGIEPSAHKRHIFSTDNFFVQNGCYAFVRELIGEAHAWNQRSVSAAVKEDVSPVIVDNTNTEAWEMKVYVEFAVKAGYDVEVLEPDTWWSKKEGELAKRNVHGVPRGTIRNMLERYEKSISPHTLLQRFQLQYSLSNAPPQPARNCKWKDRFSVLKHNKPKKKREYSNQNSFGNLNSAFLQDLSEPQRHVPSQSGLFSNLPVSIEPPHLATKETLLEVNPFENRESLTFAEDFSFSRENFKDIISIEKPQSSSCANSNLGSVMKSFSTPSVNNSYACQSNANSDLSNIPSLNSCQKAVSGSIINCLSDNQKTQNAFDFMAESNKLLAAMKRPQFSNEELNSYGSKVSEHCGLGQPENSTNESDLNLSDNPEKQPPVIAESGDDGHNCNHFILGQSESTEIAKELVDLIINTFKTEETDTDNLDLLDRNEEMQNQIDKSLDYVLINEDNAYTYQRLDSTPFCTNPFSEDFKLPTKPGTIFSTSFDSFIQTIGDLKIDEDLGFDSTIKEHSDILVEGIKKLNVESETEDRSFKVCLNEVGSLPHPSNNSDSLTPDAKENPFERVKQEESKPSLERNNPSLLGMMDEILKGMTPLCENLTAVTRSPEQKLQECLPLNLSTSPPSKPDDKVNSNIDHSDWGLGAYWSSELKDQQVSEPKPARNLFRPKRSSYLESNKHSKQESNQETYDDLNCWGSSNYSLDDWTIIDNIHESAVVQKPAILPQRQRPNDKKLVDSSTNTNYVDFSLLHGENVEGTKVLVGHRRSITEDNSWQAKTNVVETMLLDKSTMTLENHFDVAKSYDISHITSLFPNIPESFILDVVEKCQGDVNWAVDILLDSKHSIYAVSKLEPPALPTVSEPSSESNNKSEDLLQNENFNVEKNQKPPNPSLEKLAEAKRMIENVIVFGKSHYSDKVLKILKRKHPEYINLIEPDPLMSESSSSDKANSSEMISSVESGRHDGPVESGSSNEVGESSSSNEETSSGSDEESSSSVVKSGESDDDNEDLQLIFNSDLILQLQQKFGNSSLPRIPSMSPVVKLPVGLARQLYGYIMDSLQSQVDEQQDEIESMIAQDEEIAKLLQYQDEVKSHQSLQEIMDLEMALRVHRADQEEWREKSHDSVAAKLSKNILLEKFPQVDPKVLAEVLHAHNYSLHDTVSSLNLVLDGPSVSNANTPTALMGVREDEGKDDGEEEEMDPVSEAQSHREQAATYYSMRIDCLNKAQTAFRAGNKPVASYYSNLARLHKNKIETCNSRAAACLLSSHRCGSDTLDLHFLHVSEAQVVLDMFLDEVVADARDRNRRGQMVFLITGRGARSAGGVSRIKPMVQRTLKQRSIQFNEINPGMLLANIRIDTPLSCAP